MASAVPKQNDAWGATLQRDPLSKVGRTPPGNLPRDTIFQCIELYSREEVAIKWGFKEEQSMPRIFIEISLYDVTCLLTVWTSSAFRRPLRQDSIFPLVDLNHFFVVCTSNQPHVNTA